MIRIKLNRENNSYTIKKVSRTIKLNKVGRRGPQGPGGVADNITGLIQAGSNVTITGVGDQDSPYVINSQGAVQSVNGKTGAVTLNASDVGADSLGAATTALQDAKEYTDLEIDDLATVAETGDYEDLINKPTIPVINYPVTSVNSKTGAVVLNKSDIGLNNVDNTSDVNKVISNATQAALNAKYDASNPAGYITAAQIPASPVQSVNGKTGTVVINKTDVGIANVDNTSDANKPISTATQTALNSKQATLVSGTNIKTLNGVTLLGSGDYVLPVTSDATTTSKGIVQLAGDLGGTAALPTVKNIQRLFNVKDYGAVGDGTTNDYTAINNAKLALQTAGGGTLYFPKTSTNKYALGTRLSFSNMSNVKLLGETKSTSIIPLGSMAVGSNNAGIINWSGHTQAVQSFTIENLTIDANSLQQSGLIIAGGKSGVTPYDVQDVSLINMVIKNVSGTNTTTAISFIAGDSQSLSNGRGGINGIMFDRVEFDNNALYGVYFDGSNINNLIVQNSNFHDTGYSTFFLSTIGKRLSSNWKFINNRFERNMKAVGIPNGQGDFYDKNLNGIINLSFNENYFGPIANTDNAGRVFGIQAHNEFGLRIINNTFEGPGLNGNAALSIGASTAASYYKTDANQYATIEGNVFYKVRAVQDGDATFFSSFSNNYMIETEYRAIKFYSRHFPTRIEGNFIYNCNTNPPSGSLDDNAGIVIDRDSAYIVSHNYIIDDRLLRNPTVNATLTQVSGGSITATTYYVRYAWANDTGVTLASTEQSIAVSANNLLRVTIPTSPIGQGAPSGAKLCNIYVSTITGTETLQVSLSIPTKDSSNTWTMPTTGLISGAALPSSNTTSNKTTYGIYEQGGISDTDLPNLYTGNMISGMTLGKLFQASSLSSTIITDNPGIQNNAVIDGGSA